LDRRLISSGSPYEGPIGFSRAVKAGPFIAVSGTAPVNPDGANACIGDLYGQTKRSLQIIGETLEKAGCSLENVIRTRIMLRDISRWEEAAKAHGEIFSDIRPACTFVEIKGLISADWLVEIEADAYVGE
jgi:enamine deaminase RidA (YjgF/YER057c/UK114 family)